MTDRSTLLGTIEDVEGATVRVLLSSDRSLGLAFVDGRGYRIGQIGSFVRIPIGYEDLFGIISQVGASAAPEVEAEEPLEGQQWMTVQLVGEANRSGRLKRGLSQFPTVGDEVHLVTDSELSVIYGRSDSPRYVSVGNVVGSESIPSLIDVSKLVTRHSAVVGSTGAGKSTTVAALVERIASATDLRSPRVLLLDVHGEYANSMRDIADVYTVQPDEHRNEQPLHIPYWALTFEELLSVALGQVSTDSDRGAVTERVTEMKREAIGNWGDASIQADKVNADSPVPFSIHQFWFDLHREVISTYLDTGDQSFDQLAYRRDDDGEIVDPGDPMEVRPPDTLPQDNSKDADPKVYLSQSRLNLRRQIDGLAYKLRDSRYDFLFHPGQWLPDTDGVPDADLDTLLEGWVGGDNGISILDLSGVPSDILDTMVGALLRIIYDALFWARRLPEGGRQRPLLVVLEEAHSYVGKESGGAASSSVRRIAKEGRKYGVGLMLVSQRPTEIDSTILSQCGTITAMRLTNSDDRSRVKSVAADNLSGIFSMLPVLRTGEAIITGDAVKIPTRTRIAPPSTRYLPDSQDPVLYAYRRPGGWNQEFRNEDYQKVVQLWRLQDATPERGFTLDEGEVEGTVDDWRTVSSSHLSRVRYDADSLTLEIEFNDGQRYQYFDVPRRIYEGLLGADSHGSYFHENIRGNFRYTQL